MNSSPVGQADKAPEQAQVRKFNIFINDVKLTVTDPALTGTQLKSLAGIAGANHLFLDTPGPKDDVQVFDDQPFELKSGMKFYDVPVGNLGAQ